MTKKLFTSESVTEGHPDKLCDRISDSVLDAYLEKDPYAHVACECAVSRGLALVTGEISSSASVELIPLVRRTICDTGYDNPECGYDGHTVAVLTAMGTQSGDIAMGVNRSLESREDGGSADALLSTGAGDQGMMFGFACSETDEYMPMPIYLAHALTRRLAAVRKNGTLGFLRPDGKAQVTVEYDGGKAARVDTVVVSAHHDKKVSEKELREAIIENVVNPVLSKGIPFDDARILVNPTGRFVIGGPCGDAGLTGRKIIVDTYGGYARHGGGAFSGKDPTKVDRSAAYAARHIAKNIVAAGYADKCELQIAYAIGVARPVSVNIDTFGTGSCSDEKLTEAVNKVFDLRPEAIIRRLDLRRPIYLRTASYGHFGDPAMPWEKLDAVDALRAYIG